MAGRCCWNRIVQPCNTTSQCDPGGEGCVTTGTLNITKRYGPAHCQVSHSRTRQETCTEAGGKLSHPTASTWLCTSPAAATAVGLQDQTVAARRPNEVAWPATSRVQVWARNLTGGNLAVAVYNNGANSSSYEFQWEQLPGLHVSAAPRSCQDLWAKAPPSGGDGLER